MKVKSTKPTVAIVGIYKNEEKTLSRMLSSVFDFADAFYLGVDESSEDDTLRVAEKWVKLKGKGAVIPFVWKNDFSYARNLVINKVEEDWFFTMDGHEYVTEDSQKRLPNIWSIIANHPTIKGVAFSIRMGSEDSYTRADQIRLMKNIPTIRYEGALHNQITGLYDSSNKTVAYPEVVINHDRHEESKKGRDPQRVNMVTTIFPDTLKKNPKDCQALFYLGCHYHANGDIQKALKYFSKYLKYSGIKYERADVYHKLCDCYGRLGKPKKRQQMAWEGILETYEMAALWIHLGEVYELSNDWDKAAFFYNTATTLKLPSTGIFLQENFYTWIPWYKLTCALERLRKIEDALKTAHRALQCDDAPQYVKDEMVRGIHVWREYLKASITRPRAEENKGKPHIAVFDSFGSFTPPLIQDWRDRGWVVEVRKEFDESLGDWADVMWFEWCDHNIVGGHKVPWHSKIICRLHGFETFANVPAEVDWSRVSDLIFVSDHHHQFTKTKFPQIAQTVLHTIHNGVDLEKFKLIQDEYDPDGRKIVCLGYLNKKKGSDFIVDLAHAYPDYEFHIAGEFQEENLLHWFQVNAPENVKFHSWVDNVPLFLVDKNFILSPSLNESFGLTIAEGMALGLKPLIRNRPGVHDLWPEACIFTSTADFKRVITTPYDPQALRQWVVDRYDQRKQLDTIASLVESRVHEKWLQEAEADQVVTAPETVPEPEPEPVSV